MCTLLMKQIYEKLCEDVCNQIYGDLMAGVIKFGQRLPIMRPLPCLKDGEVVAPVFEELEITYNFRQKLRAYYERISNE